MQWAGLKMIQLAHGSPNFHISHWIILSPVYEIPIVGSQVVSTLLVEGVCISVRWKKTRPSLEKEASMLLDHVFPRAKSLYALKPEILTNRDAWLKAFWFEDSPGSSSSLVDCPRLLSFDLIPSTLLCRMPHLTYSRPHPLNLVS